MGLEVNKLNQNSSRDGKILNEKPKTMQLVLEEERPYLAERWLKGASRVNS